MQQDTKNSGQSLNNKRLTTFSSLRYPDYRYLWLGQLGHSAVMWMEQVIRPLLVLELTDSPFQVGLVVSFRMLPQLVFGLLAGVVADRYDRRRVLMISQTITLLMQVIMAVLLLTGNIQVWHIYVTAVISGASLAFNQPARQSLIPRLVPKEMLLNAISLFTAAMNIMRVLGAGLAGILLVFFDYGQVFSLNSLLLAMVIWTTIKVKWRDAETGEEREPAGPKKAALLTDMTDGFRYVYKNPVLFYLVGLGLLMFILSMPYQQVFIPLLALDVLNIGRSGAGWLLAFTGIGALIGSLIVASIRIQSRRGVLLMASLLLLGISMAILSRSTWLPLSALALIMGGGMSTAYMTLNNTLLLEKTTMEFHGRVLSLMSLDRGLVSLGAVMAGALAEWLGPQNGLSVMAGAMVLFVSAAFLVLRPLRKL